MVKFIFYFCLFWNLILLRSIAYAYPEFIGVGYTTCITCHFNGSGGGPLNDYGRSLFAVEIADKPFYYSKMKNEYLDKISGFLGRQQLEDWVRPYIKARQLLYSPNIYSTTPYQNITMQLAVGSTFIFGQDAKNQINFEMGYVPQPKSADKNKPEQLKNWISREYYYRRQVSDNSWIYVGFMDKPFGVKTPDHTAVNRARIGFGQNDQAHGILYHLLNENWEYFGFAYAGHLEQSSDIRQTGLANMLEYDVAEKQRVGFSVNYSQSTIVKYTRIAFHHKMGVGEQHALLSEIGLSQDKAFDSTVVEKNGIYYFGSGWIHLRRGLNLTSQIEYYKDKMTQTHPENLKWGLGLIYFPAQRFEFRTTLVTARSISPTNSVGADGISWQNQLHFSF